MRKQYWLAVLATSLMASSAFAALDATVSAPWAPDTGNGGEVNLYAILGYANNAALNAATTGQETWKTSIGNQTTKMIVEYAGNAGINTLGIYDVNNPINSVEIFAGPDGAGASTVLTISGSTIKVGAGPTLTLSSAGDTFGFYLGAAGPSTFYSQATLNGGGADQLVTVNKDGGTYLAWEDIALGSSDHDYQDMVVKLSAVPEPTTMIAGALLLLPFGASTVRALRGKRTA